MWKKIRLENELRNGRNCTLNFYYLFQKQFVYPDKTSEFCKIRLHTIGSRDVNFRTCERHKDENCAKCPGLYEKYVEDVAKGRQVNILLFLKN